MDKVDAAFQDMDLVPLLQVREAHIMVYCTRTQRNGTIFSERVTKDA
jgi:hypothetical protein